MSACDTNVQGRATIVIVNVLVDDLRPGQAGWRRCTLAVASMRAHGDGVRVGIVSSIGERGGDSIPPDLGCKEVEGGQSTFTPRDKDVAS